MCKHLREVNELSNEKQVEEQNEEVVEEVQTEAAEATEAEASEEVNPLQQENDQLKQQLEEEENRYLRLQADFDNFRRRSRLDAEAAQKYRAQSLVADILPALDNFERALQVNTADEQTKSVLQGVEMVYRQLVEALQKKVLKQLSQLGKHLIHTSIKQ